MPADGLEPSPPLYKKEQILSLSCLPISPSGQITLRIGIEPITSRLTAERSSQLSYRSFSFLFLQKYTTPYGTWTHIFAVKEQHPSLLDEERLIRLTYV